MSQDNVISLKAPESLSDPLTELVRADARELIQRVLEAELSELLSQYQECRDDGGKSGVVRNGYQPERALLTGVGSVKVKVPKVRRRLPEPVVFRSALVPPYVRRTNSIAAALPWLYLKGVSTGQMQSALEVLVGSQAKGLSANVVSRLKQQWTDEYHHWSQRRWDDERWVYLWADGIYSGLRTDSERLCLLVIIGVNAQGQKRLLAIEDGTRESTQSWREVLLNLKHRGLNTAPKLAVGEGALGFWRALDEGYPQTVHQRCWVHKTANVLNHLPKIVQPKAKTALQHISLAETRQQAEQAVDQFIHTYQAKYPKAVNSLSKDRLALLAVYDFPAAHWAPIRTTNPIESTFATIRHRTDQCTGCVTRKTMLAMVFKLGQRSQSHGCGLSAGQEATGAWRSACAEQNWLRIRGVKQVSKVIAGVVFKDGIEQGQGNKVAA